MFDLSLAHIALAERERDLVAELRDRQLLKIAATEIAPAPERAPIDRAARQPRAMGTRVAGRQG